MLFPDDLFDINTNMPASEFLQVYNDLKPLDRSMVADISKVDASQWFLNYHGHRYEVTATDNIVNGIYRR